MSHSTNTCVFTTALALCALSIPAHAAVQADDAIRPTVAHTSDSGGIILAAQRGGGGPRAGGGSAREAAGNRGGGGAVNREAAGNRQGVTSNRQVRNSASENINHNRQTNANLSRDLSDTVNVNRNVNVNQNVNVSRDVNVSRNYYDGWDDRWHPVAAAAAVTATAMAVGAIVNSIPPSCSTVVVNGISYSQCGSTWYQPQYAGTTVQYVVVNPPR